MKKSFLALLLCLALGLCATGLAEDAQTAFIDETATYQFGSVQVDLNAGDVVQYVQNESNGAILFQVFTAYDEAAQTHPNFNVAWISQAVDFSGEDADALALELVTSAAAQMETAGIASANETVLAALIGEVGELQQFTVVYSFDADYAGMGVELQITLYQEIMYLVPEGLGTYVVSLTAYSMEDLAELEKQVETITFVTE